MKELFKFYAIPQTNHKRVMYGLIETVGQALTATLSKEKDVILDLNGLSPNALALDTATDTDKLWAVLCDDARFKEKAEALIGKEKVNDYVNLASSMKFTKENINSEVYVNEQDVYRLKEKFNGAIKVLKSLDNISAGLLAYTLKYEQRTSNSGMGSQLAGFATDNTQAYGLGVGSGQLTDVLDNKFKGMATGAALSTAFPPAVIASLASGVVSTLVDVCFDSKGYGVVRHHGVKGQIRAFLLKNYLSLIFVFIKNQYKYIFQMCTKSIGYRYSLAFKSACDVINSFTNEFQTAKEVIKALPNHGRKGDACIFI